MSDLPTPKARRGFTLVEILLVVAIIGLLLGLLMPGMNMVRRRGAATQSQSNLRQWGLGTVTWADMHKSMLPWEGMKDAANMSINLAERNYWANAVPPMVGQRPYSEICDSAWQAQSSVPFDGTRNSIFIDPAAVSDSPAPWGFGQPGAAGVQHQFYFNYVPNSQMNNTLLGEAELPEYSPTSLMRLSNISDPGATVLMLELRTRKAELPSSDPYYDEPLNRQRADWKRFAARHFDGGHIAFVDGHVDFVSNVDATTNASGSRDPDTPGGDWNTSTLTWDPLGPAAD